MNPIIFRTADKDQLAKEAGCDSMIAINLDEIQLQDANNFKTRRKADRF
jgi:hypothetical protein